VDEGILKGIFIAVVGGVIVAIIVAVLHIGSSAPPPQMTPSETPTGQTTSSVPNPPGATDTSGALSREGPPPSSVQYLDDLTTVSGYVFTGSLTMSGTVYPHGTLWYCATDSRSLVYAVSGARVFSAAIGIPDNESAAGDVIAVSFYDQNKNQLGKTVSVSLGHPAKVRVDLGSAVQLEISCIGTAGITDGGTLGVGLGNAKLTR
jgi:hypothetical protein